MKPRFLPVLLLSLFCAWSSAAAEDLVVAVVSDLRPMSWRNESGQLTGFNVDVARALCTSIGARCTIVELTTAEILSRLRDNRIDVAVANLAKTPEREQSMAFTRPYYRGAEIWIGRGSSEYDLGLKVLAIRGTIQEDYVRLHEKERGWTRITASDWPAAMDALLQRQADAMVVSLSRAMNILSRREMIEAGFTARAIEPRQPAANAHVAVCKARAPALLARLDAALDAMERDGRLDHFSSTYLPFRIN